MKSTTICIAASIVLKIIVFLQYNFVGQFCCHDLVWSVKKLDWSGLIMLVVSFVIAMSISVIFKKVFILPTAIS